jgi:hypothetical protein
MKKLILLSFFIPIAGKAGFKNSKETYSTVVQVRSGEWPISLERLIKRNDTSYFLQFRDQQVTNTEVLDTLPFADRAQLKYFEQALTALKKGSNGDIANFKDYSIKRAEARTEGRWYILRYQWGMTNFQQPEADIMINTIKGL